MITREAAERSACDWCQALPGHPCTDYGDKVRKEGSHAQRWALYKNEVRYNESIWQLRTDSYRYFGLEKGDRFAGTPHWFDKTKIVVTGLVTNPERRIPTCVVNSEELYWVDWYVFGED